MTVLNAALRAGFDALENSESGAKAWRSSWRKASAARHTYICQRPFEEDSILMLGLTLGERDNDDEEYEVDEDELVDDDEFE